ncbi:hypothetical protein A2767_01775 [Candidatus Roizmanbacteria bacterium RIFCSPHIGHO2_01_FULL_35_10]|uniref:Glycosyl transferase family 1 domain-containing protein n=1 Tax=Candidatus Roizmanbacteria bacterium RIFCSPLOWO2_01_FULL_35_13 TaxID=1802055 RepID=A0A1F7I9U1_9BACT|nr:MAG: hypothetical protein A2767_01775 [Candidatus Roizmanbacteria bacterium RIFCSPHIGHO2_01_FULL_35_10]OGK40092.1 MAG: hypothetical protein A3A74_02720 [Candidatus Roizmanbacteria bacterium RIFCSPLOWO2_01_FULL_35_13]
MLKIGIDARLYGQTGVGVYLRNLLFYLKKNVKTNFLFYIYLLPQDYDKVDFKNKNFIKKLVYSPWHTFSEQLEFCKVLYKDNLDLMHFTYFSYPVLYKRKFIATIHDTTPLIYKTGKASTKSAFLYELKFQVFKFVISQQIKNAKLIITPTYTVKKQLTDFFGKKYSPKIKAVFEGVDYELINEANRHSGEFAELGGRLQNRSFEQRFRTSRNDESRFFIYIGNFYPHKNVENLIEAFSKVKTDAKLILIGPDDYFSQRLFQSINRLKQNKRIFFYHNPNKEDLVFFYKNASALIHPSLSEGFGLPIVESMYFNLPIIASNIDVFKEILGKKYISFNPKDLLDIAEKIKLFQKSEKKIDYGNFGKKFSFGKMAKQTLEYYNQVLV